MGLEKPAAQIGVAVGAIVGEGVEDGRGVLLGCYVSVGKSRSMGTGMRDLKEEELEIDTDIIASSMKTYCFTCRKPGFLIDT